MVADSCGAVSLSGARGVGSKRQLLVLPPVWNSPANSPVCMESNKVPGGKLVVVDLDVVESRLANIRLSGDFFLEPDEALGRMTDALEQLPADAPISTYEDAVEKAVDDAVMVGFDPRSVVLAVLRALGAQHQLVGRLLRTDRHREAETGHADGPGRR